MALVALTQYTDMIRALGEGSRTNTILLPHGPAAVANLMSQLREGVLVGDLAADAVTRSGGDRTAPDGGAAPS